MADDLALRLPRTQDMRDKKQALEAQGAKVGLKINATKTKLMPTGAKSGNGVSVVEGGLRMWMNSHTLEAW